MANLDSPKGFIPVKMEDGSGLPAIEYLEHTTGTAVFEGDLVKISSGNGISITNEADNPTHIAREYVAAAEATGTLFAAMPLVPGLICECQSDASALADSSQNRAFFDVSLGAGNTTTGRSGFELDDNASAQDTLILIDKVDRPDNAWGANVDVLVKIRVNAEAPVIATT